MPEMSFYQHIESYRGFDFEQFFAGVGPRDVERVLAKEKLRESDFLVLLSSAAAQFLEPMARKARRLTLQYFGRTGQLFIPLYISNYCTNQCLYCGFNRTHAIDRRKLTLIEIETEARAIARTGMQHLLLLTGEAREVTPADYLEAAVRLLKKYFASVAIEMFPMDEAEYGCLKAAGVDGLTLYQEVYDETIYRRVHLAGKKADYRYRLDAPERGPVSAWSTSVRWWAWEKSAARHFLPACMPSTWTISSWKPRSAFRCRASIRPRGATRPPIRWTTAPSCSS